ncbi:hypothetical protein ACLMAJ_16035 [Nocardia sp. KC 131]|uniref:hypothetical protein n=1 Tax=Nocardia arseniciresistens TaxID=3392119 RepID=UPI00398E4F3B
MLEPILEGVSEYRELRDLSDLDRVIGTATEITDVPTWFPTATVARAIRSRHRDPLPNDRRRSGDTSETLRLATQLLDIDSRDT